ncbi:eukaryotic translation initiation factor 4 gamma 1 isoform X1 [Pelobates cultripes]|uniref:Eukaryotic translation initiation factor 4 gamma 1 isoform X1 n=1 Tax=Pelobates cultripes TaxID=61616 RepID=A0AAD1SPA2_PELCU|nr:eukaryotic translation initiation factor 4 gamma 1 isoform X1 [Pelobates cultripes]
MECICLLLTSVEKYLENGKSRMDDYFSNIDILIKNGKTSSRIRFIVKDVLDLRRNNWVPQHKNNQPEAHVNLSIDPEEQSLRETEDNEKEPHNETDIFPKQITES